MRLLDVADVHEGTGAWYKGWEGDSRACSMGVELADACDPFQNGVLLPGGDTGVYSALPFGIVGTLKRPVNCIRDDDEKWAMKALESLQEYALSRALVSEPVAGTEAWLGADAVTEVPAPTGTTDADLANAAAAARAAWYRKAINVDDDPIGQPIMHVTPEAAPALARGGVLDIEDGDVRSIWGDRVVIAPGYSVEDNPPVFFTGPIDIYLSSVGSDGLLVASRTNRTNVVVDQVAVIDIDPCSIVRVGPMAAGTSKLAVIATQDADDQCTFTFIAENAVGTVTWRFGDGQTGTSASDAPITHTYACVDGDPAKDYKVSATDSDGGTGFADVTVLPPPIILCSSTTSVTPSVIPIHGGTSNPTWALNGTSFTPDTTLMVAVDPDTGQTWETWAWTAWTGQSEYISPTRINMGQFGIPETEKTYYFRTGDTEFCENGVPVSLLFEDNPI